MINTDKKFHLMNIKTNKSANKISLFIIPVGMILLLAAGLATVNVIYAETNSTQSLGSKHGTITSVQNGKDGKPAWNLSGNWNSTGLNSKSPTFDAKFRMAKLDGSATHTHTISNFKITGSPVNDKTGMTLKGTTTVSMKEKPVDNVPTTIVISSNGDVSITLDPQLTSDHFGNTPIKGKTA